MTGGQSLNKSLDYSVGAFRASSIVNEALLGIQPHDLENVVIGNSEVLKGLAGAGAQLGGFVHTFNLTLGALAARQQALSQTIAVLPGLLQNTNTSDTALDRSFPPTQQFAAAIVPGIKQLGPTISAALPWLSQATALSSQADLGGLLKDLSPAVDNTAHTIGATKSLISQSDLLARCFTHNLVPTGNQVINDGPASSGEQVYQELFDSSVGIAGASATSTATAAMSGPQRRRHDPWRNAERGSRRPVLWQLRAPAARDASGVRRSRATFRSHQAVLREPGAEPEQRQDGSRAVKRAIIIHRQDFAAIIALVLAAIVVVGYILLHQPAFTLFKSYYTVRAEFSTGAAVTAGQGQTVDIAGVEVGQIGGVSYQDGHAVVTMNIYKKYGPIYNNATVLLRPRTPLQDMYLALDPGTKSAGAVPAGGMLGVASTQPDINTDQILNSLDADTRNYLLLLLAGGAQLFQNPSNPTAAGVNEQAVDSLRGRSSGSRH